MSFAGRLVPVRAVSKGMVLDPSKPRIRNHGGALKLMSFARL